MEENFDYGANPTDNEIIKKTTISNLQAVISQRDREIKILRKGISAVRGLMNDSHGVTGLHLNGDIAEWSELERGGQYEEWLIGFNEAEI